MRIDNYLNLSGRPGFSGLFFACGDFGIVDGDIAYERFEEDKKTVFEAQNGKIKLRAEFERDGDVCIRRDSLENISGEAIEINGLVSRFCLDGNDYDVYTQYSAWQHESTGEWQRLTTQIRAEACGMRGCDGAAPIMGFSNRYNGKNTVFHLLPNAQWQMAAKKIPENEKEMVVFEAGFCSKGLRLFVQAGEKIALQTDPASAAIARKIFRESAAISGNQASGGKSRWILQTLTSGKQMQMRLSDGGKTVWQDKVSFDFDPANLL